MPDAFSRSNPDPTASPDDVFLAIGEITGAHGIRGEVRMAIYTERPEQIPELRQVYFDDDPSPVPLAGARLHSKHALLQFEHVTDRNQAEALRGTVIRITGSQLAPPEEGAFYYYQIIGLAVYDEAGAGLGRITDILDSGEIDVYVVENDRGEEYLFPALHDVVLDIDPDADRVIVRPQTWDDEPV